MKKSIVYILALVMAFSMMGCGMHARERRAEHTPNSATIIEDYRNERDGVIVDSGNRNVTGETIIDNTDRDERVVAPVNP